MGGSGRAMTSRRSEEARRNADEYLSSHRILETLNDLATALCFHKPHGANQVRDFLIRELQRRKIHGKEAGLFDNRELDAVFNLADLQNSGLISDSQCREALLSLACSEQQHAAISAEELPKEVDRSTFLQKAKTLLA